MIWGINTSRNVVETCGREYNLVIKMEKKTFRDNGLLSKLKLLKNGKIIGKWSLKGDRIVM